MQVFSGTNAGIASTEDGILPEEYGSGSDISEGSESPNSTLKAELKKIHELWMKFLVPGWQIEDPSDIE